jgi:hypothetical protein
MVVMKAITVIIMRTTTERLNTIILGEGTWIASWRERDVVTPAVQCIRSSSKVEHCAPQTLHLLGVLLKRTQRFLRNEVAVTSPEAALPV